MKKRLFSLLTIAALTTTAWADISTEQLNTYLKASGTDVVLEQMQKQIASGIEMKVKMSGQEISADDLKMITDIFSKKENVKQFTKGIKALDEKDYKEIIKFYNTKIGKKSVALVKDMDMLNNQQKIAEFSKKELPKERKNLITQLVDASMFDEKMERLTQVMMEATIDAMPEDIQSSLIENMDAQMAQMKPIMQEQVEKSTTYIYRDYSDAEIKLLITHYKTPSAEKETDAIIDGTGEYMKTVMSQMMKEMKKKYAHKKN